MTPEAKVKKKVKEVLEEYNAYYAMTITNGFGNSGVPDFLVCYRGRFIGIECKAGKGKVTALQQDNLNRIADSGGTSLIINESNIDTLIEEFRKYD